MERVKYARRRCPVFNESISFTIPVHHVCSRTLPSTFFCHASNQCMIYYDRLSGWPAVFEFVKRDLCYHDVIRSCMRCFFDFGMPVRIRSDGGTNLTSAQTLAFFDNWGVTAVNLTPPPLTTPPAGPIRVVQHSQRSRSPTAIILAIPSDPSCQPITPPFPASGANSWTYLHSSSLPSSRSFIPQLMQIGKSPFRHRR